MSHLLLEQIVAATAGEYHIAGELGETNSGTAFLARDAASGRLVVLFVPAGAESLEVLAALSGEVPANAGRCTACGYAPMVWTAACPNCERPFTRAAIGADRFTLDEVQAATAHVYEVEGELAHLSGGSLFFVRDRADRRLVALAGQVDADGQQVLEAVWDAVTPHPGVHDAAGAAGQPLPNQAPAQMAADEGNAFAGAAGAVDSYDGYTPEGAPVAAPPARRRWGPLVAAGALLVLGGAAWALWRGSAGDGPSSSGTVAVARTGAGAAPGGAGGSALAADSARRLADSAAAASNTLPETTGVQADVPPVDPAEEARRRAADSARQAARAPAFIQITPEPPVGWSWRIDGRPGPASRTARLRPRREHVIEVEAPGYCPDVLRFVPEPATTQQWTPRLRGKPMIGEC